MCALSRKLHGLFSENQRKNATTFFSVTWKSLGQSLQMLNTTLQYR